MKAKALIIFLLVSQTATLVIGQGFFAYKLPLLGGDTLDCNKLRGQKVMILAGLPAQVDSQYYAFKNFATAHSDLIIIGLIQGDESDVSLANAKKIAGFYDGMTIVFALPGKLGKASGSQQIPLAQWLTRKELNSHFDRDANEIGTRFFVDETGRLYAVIGAQTPWTSPIFAKILSAKPPLTPQ
jgi:glutathione peroxidase